MAITVLLTLLVIAVLLIPWAITVRLLLSAIAGPLLPMAVAGLLMLMATKGWCYIYGVKVRSKGHIHKTLPPPATSYPLNLHCPTYTAVACLYLL